MTIFPLMLAAVVLDWLLGEPRRWHPLVGFGRLAAWLERRIYVPDRWRGVFAVALLTLPPTWLASELAALPGVWGLGFSVWALYFALGHKSLHGHVRPIIAALARGDEAAARAAAARIVSRDAETLEIAPSAIESTLENGSDGVFGALFWFLVAGAPGAILYRLANTLDATWGYKTPRYLEFGWAAANLDDMLNIVPARFTALTYAILGKTRQALDCWREQAPAWDSPNAGPVMAAGAGALGIRLGGRARYQGEWHERPVLGVGNPPEAADIERALALVRHGVLLWLAVIGLGALAWRELSRASPLLPGILNFLWENLLA
ncbi:MAG: adenosylcobinamide-phosphate synthase CbiB [Pseudomonadota bacterium]|nr:adenosylcobinamide-phosphate synthase CbiB [Pseudomonadota bacterium]MDP1903086.1 adenosylcobinamide-phosphate synthase CbiB [Pseudomonadota bacterium]MDP2353076.1 adenosylcobinamide-phosphate synthase CbiB [Pseudomonadota bacterium]